jgi:type I restriction enzyme, R subunit
LDLRYEARDIPQHVQSQDKIDQWFEAKTRGLTDHVKARLKKRWGTLKELYSSEGRLSKIVVDIIQDILHSRRFITRHLFKIALIAEG